MSTPSGTSDWLHRYLDRHAEPIARELANDLPQFFQRSLLPHTYRFVLVIPVHDESWDCLGRVLPTDIHHTLVIVVVNAAEDHEPKPIQHTQAFLKHFFAAEALFTGVAYNPTTTLLLVNCCTDGHRLPAKQGVGLARKIGGDLALAAMAQHVVSYPWIHCTDADVNLPWGYFDDTLGSEQVAVAIYPFRHDPAHGQILQYEISLRYYVTQLAAAGSPYAFHTIGSLLKIQAHHYAAVRGFPKRRAAEDFYMLNKLAKTGLVLRLPGPEISLSARVSHRVPFGTGAMMARLAQGQSLCLYHPDIFAQLRTWLRLIERLGDERATLLPSGLPTGWAQHIDQRLLNPLLALGVEAALAQAYRQSRDYSHFQFFLWGWFDAFRTLKLVHALRDRDFPSVPLARAIALTARTSEPPGAAPANITEPMTVQTWQQINDQLRIAEQQLPSLIGPTQSLYGLTQDRGT
jgi:hypothetical protein